MPISFLEEIKDVISTNIPTSPTIADEIIKTIYDESSGAKDIFNIIKNDPPIAAKILQVVNSAFYGTPNTIDSLERAVVILGYNTIKELVTTIAIIPYFFRAKDSLGLDIPGLWIHSIGVARASQFIAEQIHFEYPGIAYTVGLLHDIGKIIIAVYFPEHYYKIIDLQSEKNVRIILAERKVLQTDHTMIGKILCDQWNFSEDISNAILHHHDPYDAPRESQMLTRIIELGDYVCRDVQIGNPGDELKPKPSDATFALLGQNQDEISNNYNIIFEKLIDQKTEIEDLFSSVNSSK